MKKFRFSTILLLSLVFFASCEDYFKQFDIEIDPEVELSPSFVTPIAYGSFSLKDILTEVDSAGFVEETEDSLLYIYYTDIAYSVTANELVELPNSVTNETYFESDINIPAWGGIGVGQPLTFFKREDIDFELDDDDRLDSVIINSGRLHLNVSSEFKHEGALTISSPNIFDPSGDTLVQLVPISQLDGNFTFTQDFDLSGYHFNVERIGDKGVLKIHFALLLTKSANPISVGERCLIDVDLQDLEFSHLYGFISEREVLNEQQSMELPINDFIAEITAISFKDPQINLFVHNSYGISASLDMEQSRVRSALDDNFYDIVFNPGIMPFLIGAPVVEDLGETVTTTLEINNTTSNLTEVIDRAPNLIEFGVVATTGSLMGGGQSFILDTSKLTLETELILPMWLRTSNYTRRDTIEFDLAESLSELGFVDTIAVKLKTINQLPIELDIQAYFLDGQYQVLDSLIKTDEYRLLKGAPVNTNGELERDLLEENEFVLGVSGDQLNMIGETKYILLKVLNASTSGDDYVKFFSNYELDYKLSVEADFRLNTSELDSETE